MFNKYFTSTCNFIASHYFKDTDIIRVMTGKTEELDRKLHGFAHALITRKAQHNNIWTMETSYWFFTSSIHDDIATGRQYAAIRQDVFNKWCESPLNIAILVYSKEAQQVFILTMDDIYKCVSKNNFIKFSVVNQDGKSSRCIGLPLDSCKIEEMPLEAKRTGYFYDANGKRCFNMANFEYLQNVQYSKYRNKANAKYTLLFKRSTSTTEYSFVSIREMFDWLKAANKGTQVCSYKSLKKYVKEGKDFVFENSVIQIVGEVEEDVVEETKTEVKEDDFSTSFKYSYNEDGSLDNSSEWDLSLLQPNTSVIRNLQQLMAV